MTKLALVALAIAIPVVSGIAAEKPPTESSPAEIQATAAAGDEQAPVPVPAPSEEALRYYRSGNLLWFVDLAWGVLILAFFLFTGLSARIRTWAQRLGRKWFFVSGIYLGIFVVFSFIINLPLSYYEGFVRQHAYGLSNQTPAKWWGDQLKSLAVVIAAGFSFLWIPYLLVKKSPRRWWLYTALLAIPSLLFVLLIAPIWVDPLFNDFGPMHDKALESTILALAQRAGIDGSRVYEVNKSIDTSEVNAYVTGLFQTKRIVLWDTILAKMTEKELLVVVGHELGHYVLHHIVAGVIFSFFLMLAVLYVTYRLAGGLIGRYKNRFGFDRLSDIASLPLLVLLTGILSFAMSPIAMAFSRYQEHEADRFALEITRDNHDAATAFVKLQQDNLEVPRPGPLYRWWRCDHPPVGERIDFCNEYHPWRSGKPLKYEDRFQTKDVK